MNYMEKVSDELFSKEHEECKACKGNKRSFVELSKSQCESLADFIELYLVQSIRDGECFEEMALIEIVESYKILRAAGKGE